MAQVNIEFPEKLHALFEPMRYKVLHGGRGGAKSWGIAAALCILGAENPKRYLCAREFQNSMADSVHKLIADTINRFDMGMVYKVQRDTILGSNGTSFVFHGLRHNINNIKSLEGIDIAWVEEAQTVSKASWEILIPTIRKEGSEIWVSFNPELQEDETYKRFVLNPPTKSKVVKIGWQDNPWFPSVLYDEMIDLKAKDYQSYLNIWEGHCKQSVDGAIYANELLKATSEGRICKVPYIVGKPVHTAMDIGYSDLTTIWFYQFGNLGQPCFIDYHQDSKKKMVDYIQFLQSKQYVYGTNYLPHDAANENIAADKTPAGHMRAAGFNVQVLSRSPINIGIDATRTMFDNAVFDEQKCADGLQSIRHYRYDIDPVTKQPSRQPLHDWASHGADGLRYAAVSMREKKEKKKLPAYAGRRNWMGS